jgi:hypothetical protein
VPRPARYRESQRPGKFPGLFVQSASRNICHCIQASSGHFERNMAVEEAQGPSEQPERPGPIPPARPGRRPGRGRRGGRGRRPGPRPAPIASTVPEAPLPSAPEVEPSHTPSESAPAPFQPEPVAELRPAAPAAVKSAIEEVNQIIATLQETLGEMEEVLETLELAERQKDADEREIESLRRALRQMSRPREGHQAPRH